MATQSMALPRARRRVRQRDIVPYLFILPNLLLFMVFVFGPMLFSFGMSFTRWDGLGTPEPNGVRNYLNLLRDDLFMTSVRNTVVYSLGTVLPLLAFSLGLALVLDSPLRGRTFFRAMIYLPVVISWVAGALVWRLMFIHPDGIINSFLTDFGLPAQLWTSDPVLALPAIVFMSLWKNLGFYTVIFLAGLQTIPITVYEAGKIDGANRWQLFWSITLPLLRPTTLFALVIGIIGSFEVFVPVYLMTNGGPGYSSMVMVMAIYRAAFQQYQMGYASAMAVILFLAIFAISWLQFKFFGREVEY
ncbi:MAG: sugar ABC transporter permease [Chloroflexi bacterium]|nr:sugar ABC transporter permease [Chloroflexota bacterium]